MTTADREDDFPFGDGVTGVLGGKLYVLSGCFYSDPPQGYFENCDPLFFRYSPASDQWVRLPSPFVGGNAGNVHMGSGVIAGKFYVMGSGAMFAMYDPATNQWTKKTAPTPLRPEAATAVLDQKLYMMGGQRWDANGNLKTLDITIVYDPVTDAWTQRTSLPRPRDRIAATKVWLNGKPRIELVGGSAPGNNLQYIP